MSAAAAPELRLVPPTPVPAAPSPDHKRRLRRARVIATWVVVTGALLPVSCVAAARWLGDAVYPALIFSWAVLVAGGCLVGLVVLIASHTAADFRAAMLAIASIVVGVMLLPAAGRVGTEAYVSSHATELESLAARLRAEGGTDDMRNWIVLQPRTQAVRAELAALGVRNPGVVDGGLVFPTSVPFGGGSLLYADGVPGRIRLACQDIRAIGGRWYIVGCGYGYMSDD
jgi:hypothetical protein